MKIIIVTQEERIYLPKVIKDFLTKCRDNKIEVVGIIVNSAYVEGKKTGFLARATKYYRVFGGHFFSRYALKYLSSLIQLKSIRSIVSMYNVPIINLEQSINNPKSIKKIRGYNPDIMVSILNNQIFKQPAIDACKLGILNLHTSLLPNYRGIMPVFWAMKHSEKIIGVSVFLVDQGIDTGPLMAQQKVSIDQSDTLESLIIRTKEIGIKLIIDTLIRMRNGFVEPIILAGSCKGSYYSFPKRQDVLEFYRLKKRFY